MLYTAHQKNFKEHIHPSLQKRLRIFLIIAAVMLVITIVDVVQDHINILWILLAILLGAILGIFTSRIFHIAWNHDGQNVVGKIDKVGVGVLIAYIVIEIARSLLLDQFFPPSVNATAMVIGFAFISSALLSRVIGMRGRMIQVLREQKVFG
jgi:hypothetical protein